MNTMAVVDERLGLQLAGMAIRALAQPLIWALWLGMRGAVGLCSLWRPVGLFVALAGVVALCAAVPALPLGLAITAVVGWVTKPRARALGGVQSRWGR